VRRSATAFWLGEIVCLDSAKRELDQAHVLSIVKVSILRSEQAKQEQQGGSRLRSGVSQALAVMKGPKPLNDASSCSRIARFATPKHKATRSTDRFAVTAPRHVKILRRQW
jgi:hypothetical protein